MFESNRRSTGNKVNPHEGYLPNGKPDLSPSAGYVKAEPVQYADESDEQFQKRVIDWETRKETAMDIEAAGGDTQQDTFKAKMEHKERVREREDKLDELREKSFNEFSKSSKK